MSDLAASAYAKTSFAAPSGFGSTRSPNLCHVTAFCHLCTLTDVFRFVQFLSVVVVGVLVLLKTGSEGSLDLWMLAWIPKPADIGTVRRVANSLELQIALITARPGQTIELADGTYRGNFVIASSGTSEAPITLRGQPGTVLDGGAYFMNYGLLVRGNFWRIENVSFRNAKKGIVLHGASNNVLSNIHVADIGEEAIRLRNFSSGNTVENCTIMRTGLLRAGYGEGIYIGTADGDWQDATAGMPDRSDGTRVLNCVLGPHVSAELIDIKEGTSGGLIQGNVLNGTGVSGENFADSLVDIKGNAYVIAENRAIEAGPNALQDGIQVHQKLEGWGLRNLLRNNQLGLNVAGYGILVQTKESDSGANRIENNNVVTGARRGVTNIAAVAAVQDNAHITLISP
jgi:hypothetical protein